MSDTGLESLLAALPRDADGFVKVSAGALAGSAVVINGATLRQVRVSRGSILANFVSSTFEKCVFEGIRSKERFWAANDHWLACSFRGARLVGMISPGNRFENCEFTDVVIKGYRCHATEFRNCRFRQFHLEAYRATKQSTFFECRFEESRFSGCQFGNTRFVNCSFLSPAVEDCDFSGAEATPSPWWEPGISGTPFMGFLRELAIVCEKKLGAKHSITREVDAFRAEFLAGRTSSSDFEERVIGPATAEDLRRIDKDLFHLYERFGL